MNRDQDIRHILEKTITAGDHRRSNYFDALKQLVAARVKETDPAAKQVWQEAIDSV